MNKMIARLTIAVLFTATAALAQDKVPLKTDLPKPLFVGTPVPIKVPNLEPEHKRQTPGFHGARRHDQSCRWAKKSPPAPAIRSSARWI